MGDLDYIDRPLFQRLFGVAVREARESYAWSIAELHARSGVSVARLRRIEVGKVWVGQKAREALNSTLNIEENRLEQMVGAARIGYLDQLNQMFNLESFLEPNSVAPKTLEPES